MPNKIDLILETFFVRILDNFFNGRIWTFCLLGGKNDILSVRLFFRDRKEHLHALLHHLHPLLQRQQLDYQIFVIEQASQADFNRGALMNVGYLEASKTGAFFCFVLHDVDLVPEDDRLF